MSHEIRWRRIAAYLLVLPLPGALAYVLAQSAAAWFVWGHVRAEIQVAAADHSALVQSVRQQLAWIEANVERPSEYPPNRVGDWDVLRQQQMQRLQTWIQRNDAGLLAYEVRHSRWRAMAEAIAAPLSRGSSGIVMIAGNQRSYPAPIELWSLVFNDLLGWGWSRRTFAVQNTAAVGGLLGVASFLMFPAAFILLPVSRRRAKVRWAHLGRIAAYGLILPPIMLLVACALLAVGGFDARFSGITARLLLLTSAFGAPLLGVIWWACATRCYLRMPHAWTMTALLWLAVWLVNLAALYWVLGDRLIEVFI